MYKRILTALAALTIAVSVTACGKSSSQAVSGATQQTKPAQTEAATESTAPGFTPIVLVENENCTFTITGIEEDGFYGYTLKVFLENKTDKDLMFSLDNVSVNGFMCDPFWAATVAAGKKANEKVSFMESDFETNGITTVEDITFTLSVYDSNDWTAEHLVDEVFTVNP